jgi:hypothetical protein
MFLYKFLDLPNIPSDLIRDINLPSSLVLREMGGPSYQLSNGIEVETYSSTHYAVSIKFEKWIKDYISNNYTDIGIRYTHSDNNKTTSIAHTDLTRNYTLLYNLNSAGGHIKIWQEHGYPIARTTPGYIVKDYSKLDLLEQVDTPNNQWYLLNSTVLHSVEGIVGTRINIQLGFANKKDLPKEWLTNK